MTNLEIHPCGENQYHIIDINANQTMMLEKEELLELRNLIDETLDEREHICKTK